MKKNLTVIIIMLLSIITNAQNGNDHISFQGISFSVPLNKFIEQLKQKGYDFIGKSENDPTFNLVEGQFLNEKCTISIISTKNEKVGQLFITLGEAHDSWYSIKGRYEDLKKIFIKKYGNPKKSYEYFKDPYYEGDGYELQAVKKGKCIHILVFFIPNGSITIAMDKDCKLLIVYEDEKNMKIRKQEQDAKSLEDI